MAMRDDKDKELERAARALLAEAILSGGHYTQRELRDELQCDMNVLSRVLKRIVIDRATKSLVIDGEMPDWLDKLLRQIGRGLLKAIDERSREDLAQRRIVTEDAMLTVQGQLAEYDLRQREAAANIGRLERQLEGANARAGEEKGRRQEVEKREKQAQAENKRLTRLIEKLSAKSTKKNLKQKKSVSAEPATTEDAVTKQKEAPAEFDEVAEETTIPGEMGGPVDATANDEVMPDAPAEPAKEAPASKPARKPGRNLKGTKDGKGKKSK